MIGTSDAILSLSANTTGTQPGSQYVVLTVTAPEPSTSTLFLVGLALLALYRLRTRQPPV